jgi:hypothetical protein
MPYLFNKKYFPKLALYIFLSAIVVTPLSCTSKYLYTSKTTKPVTRNRHYNPKKDKNKKRVKTIKVKA